VFSALGFSGALSVYLTQILEHRQPFIGRG
jgi:hypothetical protein